jgi:hypothetical protein
MSAFRNSEPLTCEVTILGGPFSRMEGKLSLRSKGRLVTNQWTERVYVLNEETKDLTYYQENKGSAIFFFSLFFLILMNRKRSYRGQVSLKKAQLSNCQNVGKEFAFELTAHNSSDVKEVMVLAAPSHEEMISWITTISRIASCDADWITLPNCPEPPQEDHKMARHSAETTPETVSLTEGAKETTVTISATVETITNAIVEEKETIETKPPIILLPPEELTTPKEEGIVVPLESKLSPHKDETPFIALAATESPIDDEQSSLSSIRGDTIPEPRGGAPFLRGSSGYDFGTRAENFGFHSSADSISEESDSTPPVQHLRPPPPPPPTHHTKQPPPPPPPRLETSPDPPTVSWQLSCHCTNIFPRIGNKLMRRCHLHEQLFPPSATETNTSSTVFDFDLVKELLLAESLVSERSSSSSSQLAPLSLPYLSTNGCNWNQILKYLEFVERTEGGGGGGGGHVLETGITLTLECSLRNEMTSRNVQFEIVISLNSGREALVEKVGFGTLSHLLTLPRYASLPYSIRRSYLCLLMAYFTTKLSWI